MMISLMPTAVIQKGSASISKQLTFHCHRISASRLPNLSAGAFSESSVVALVALLPCPIPRERPRG
jgi:hypothetical protein